MKQLPWLLLLIATHTYAQKDPLASVYQYQVKVETRTAFLWIPPHCKYVRGIIFAMENALEKNWMEDPIVRKAAEDEDLAMVFLADGTPGTLTTITYEMKPAARQLLDKMFVDMATISGYTELKSAPLILTGHSWNGRAAWTYTSANPGRVIIAIPIRTYPMPDTLQLSGVPLCYIVGQTTELPQYSDGRPGDRDFFWPIVRHTALALRAQNESNLIGVVTYPGGCHMDWSDDQSQFLALLIHKACKYRLPDEKPADGKVSLRPITPDMGWVTDTGGMDPDRHLPAPYRKYKGDPKRAYWFFDKELALAARTFNGDRKPRSKQMITFIKGKDTLPVKKNGYIDLPLETQNDGMHFTVKGGFLQQVPEGLIDAGDPLGHAANGAFSFRVVMGPCVQEGPDSFRIAFDRQKPRNIMIMATQPGDDNYRRALQPAVITILPVLTNGPPQTIDFPEIKDQPASSKPIPLHAVASSGLPVSYYVVSGPAIINDHQLQLTGIPPRSKYPVAVTVVAYQWGTPQVQSAPAVTRSFLIYASASNP